MTPLVLELLVLVLCLSSIHCGVYNIVDFGAIASDESYLAAIANSNAINAAFKAATAKANTLNREKRWGAVLEFSDASYSQKQISNHTSELLFYNDDATVLIPENMIFTLGWTVLTGFNNVRLQIEGTLHVSRNATLWEQAPRGNFGVLHFENCHGITIQGKTQTFTKESPLPTTPIDFIGDGYDWWVSVIVGKYDHRPHMFYMNTCTSMMIHSLYVTNAPMFHFLTSDGKDFYFKNIVIFVDTVGQHRLMLDRKIPVFPLNTDGIDPSAQNVLIEDFYIENFDDAVAVKPCRQESKYCSCASDMVIRNGKVKYSVGLTIGSVPPNPRVNCVRNITFDNITMDYAFKMIYIKSNPGTNGTGIIDNINYFNIHGRMPLWYPIWIGPQQQKQPGNGSDTGCSFFYPVNRTCATQPRVSISNISLVNVTSVEGISLPGVILCDPANPCKNIKFDNVSNTGVWLVETKYECHNAVVTQTKTTPQVICGNS